MFQVPSIVNTIKTLVDGGCKLDITTRELKPSEMTELFQLKNKEGWLLFKENEIKEKDLDNIPEAINDEFDKKTPSQRFRDRLFVYYKQTHNDTKGFNDWYISTLDTLGQQYLDKLN